MIGEAVEPMLQFKGCADFDRSPCHRPQTSLATRENFLATRDYGRLPAQPLTYGRLLLKSRCNEYYDLLPVVVGPYSGVWCGGG